MSDLIGHRKDRFSGYVAQLIYKCASFLADRDIPPLFYWLYEFHNRLYSKTCVKQPLKNRHNNDLNDKW